MIDGQNKVILYRIATIVCAICLVFTVHMYDQMTMMSPDDVRNSSSSSVETLTSETNASSSTEMKESSLVSEINASSAKELKATSNAEEVKEATASEKPYDEENVQRLAKRLARAFPRSSKEQWCLPGILPIFKEVGLVDEKGELLKTRAGEKIDDRVHGAHGRRLANTVGLGTERRTRGSQNRRLVHENERKNDPRVNVHKANRNSYGNNDKATNNRYWNSNSSNKGTVGQRRVKLQTQQGSLKEPAGKKKNAGMMKAATVNDATIPATPSAGTPKNFTKGVLLTKVPKSASSTMSGITVQILLRNKCGEGNIFHQLGKFYRNRDKSHSFMFAPARDPASRAISQINYRKVSLSRMAPTDENVLEALNGIPYSRGVGGVSLPYVTMNTIAPKSMWIEKHPIQVRNASLVEETVKNVIHDYDFFVVVERMDESLVALAILMGIDVLDVVAIGDAKVAGSGFSFSFVTRKCTPLEKLVFNEGRIGEFLDSDKWRAMNYGDYLLHAAANHSLDMTIASLGSEYERAFSRYMQLKTLAEETCAPSVKMPCDTDGNIQDENDCLFRDFACGHRCAYDLANNRTETDGDV